MALDLHLEADRKKRAQLVLQSPGDCVRVLIRNEPQRYLGHGGRRDDRLRSLAGVAGQKAVHVERWPGPDAVEEVYSLFTVT